MCGLCSGQCPTYDVSRHEAETPRGRIALIQGLLRGQIEHTVRVEQHLDSCLACRSCERACPSGVRYGRLIDGVRDFLQKRRSGPLRQRLARSILASLTDHKFLARGVGRVLRLYQFSGARRLFRGWRPVAMLPRVPRPRRWRRYYPATGPAQGKVGLFTGCIASVLDTDTLAAAVRLINRCGYAVSIPKKQACCGAMHLHGGDVDRACAMAMRNLHAFDGPQAVVSAATGCGAMLAEYAKLPGLPEIVQQSAADFASRHRDVTALLAESPMLETLAFRPLPMRVGVHIPCSQRNVLRQADHSSVLLRRIPELEAVAVGDSPRCCGAAGTYVLTQPEMADRLRDELLDGLAGVDLLVSTNIGCAMHLSAGLRARGLDMEVVHPVVLLARQLAER